MSSVVVTPGLDHLLSLIKDDDETCQFSPTECANPAVAYLHYESGGCECGHPNPMALCQRCLDMINEWLLDYGFGDWQCCHCGAHGNILHITRK